MPVRLATEPVEPLWRIGRAPDPLAWPPRAFAGGGRYDDPRGRFRVLYVAAQRRGAFVETLAGFRPAVADLAMMRALPEGDADDVFPTAGAIPDTYFRKLIGRVRLAPGQRWLDLRAPETHQVLRVELTEALVGLGYGDRFVWGEVLGHDHRLTQVIARWAYESEYRGLAYSSCHDARLDCWAVFEGAVFEAEGRPEGIDQGDPDLVAVAGLFGLAIGLR